VTSLLVLGCACDSGGGEGAGDPISTEDAMAVCEEFGAHSDECSWNGNVNQADWNCGEAALVWREDVFRALAACAIALPCDGDEQSCFVEAFDTDPLAIHVEYAAACEAKKTECALTPIGDASSLILTCDAARLAVYVTPILDDVLVCFDLACDAVVPCLDDAL
jgi:hypothetical protein